MESFLKRTVLGNADSDAHKYFLRFGKGDYRRRFLISLNKSGKIKIRASFELANDLVKFVNENKKIGFSGKILTKEKMAEMEGKKKAGVIIYEISNSNIDEFKNVYYYLLDANDSEIVLKIKKSLPKPGKDEEKIDNKFCSLDIDLKYWPMIKETFFWDVPDCKSAQVEHELIINEIELPKEETDPVKIRENAKRKGKIVRKITADGKEIIKEYNLNV